MRSNTNSGQSIVCALRAFRPHSWISVKAEQSLQKEFNIFLIEMPVDIVIGQVVLYTLISIY